MYIKDKTVGWPFSNVVDFPSVDKELSWLGKNIPKSFPFFPHLVQGVLQ